MSATERICNAVKELRLESGLSQKDFAAKVGITPGSLCKIENVYHGMTIATLFRIAEALNIYPSEIVRRCEK